MFDKKIILIGLFIVNFCIGAHLHAQAPVIKFDVDTADFGVVQEGDTVKYDFWFTNTGASDLVIKQAWPACGCTHPSFTKGAIKPGERGVIHVEFLSQGWGGHEVVKEVIIISNAPENYARFKAKITAKSKIKRDDADQHNHGSNAVPVVKQKKSKKTAKKKKKG